MQAFGADSTVPSVRTGKNSGYLCGPCFNPSLLQTSSVVSALALTALLLQKTVCQNVQGSTECPQLSFSKSD